MSAQWYYARQNQQFGPLPEAQLLQLARTGLLKPTDMLWKEGMPQWAPASSIPNLFPPVGKGVPPAPPPLPVQQAGQGALLGNIVGSAGGCRTRICWPTRFNTVLTICSSGTTGTIQLINRPPAALALTSTRSFKRMACLPSCMDLLPCVASLPAAVPSAPCSVYRASQSRWRC